MKYLIPDRKVGAGTGFGIPLGIIVVYVLNNFVLAESLSTEVAAAVGSIVVGLVAYLIPSKRG